MVEIGLELLSVAFELLIYYFFFHFFFGKAVYSTKVMWLVYICVGAASLFLTMEVTSRNLRLTGYFLVVFCLALCYQGSIFIKLFLPFLFQAVSIMIERCYAAILLPMRINLLKFGDIGQNFYFLVGVVLSNLTILLVLRVFYACKEYLFLKKQESIAFPYYFVILFLFPISMIFLIDRFYVGIAQNGKFSFIDILPILVLTAITIGFFFFFDFLTKYQYEHQRAEIFHKQLEQERLYHEILLNKHQQFQGLRHDSREHFNTIASLIKSNHESEALEYAQNQAGKLAAVAAIQTGYPLLDTILTLKEEQAREVGTSFQCFVCVGVPDISFIEIDELASLLDNIINNAIEAVEHIPDYEKRKIWCKLIAEDNYLRIIVRNTVLKNVEIIDNMIGTSKADKHSHGLGLANIKRIVNKYNGNYSLECENNIFTTKILLPMLMGDAK